MTQIFDDRWIRKMLTDLPYAACLTDPNLPDNPLIFVNELFCELTGYKQDELIGQNCRLLQVDDTDANELAKIRNAVENGGAVASDLLNQRADGSLFWNRLSIKPIRDDQGVLQRFIAIQMEVEDNPYEALLEKQRQSAAALSELHHRLKNHLSLIMSSVRLQIRENGENDGLLSVLSRIQSLQTLYASMQQGIEAPPGLDQVALFDYLTTICEAITGLNAGVDLICDVPDEPFELGHNRAAQLGMIVAELVTNAMQHAFDGEGGEVTLYGRLRDEEILITVSDNGRGQCACNPIELGTGLGGKILRQMAKNLSATIDVTPSSSGVSVSVTLPIEK
ncbi:hypothetical protein GCM10016455_04650 [Aliiroseovarius zhejiangensis]|uniref:PAS domain-containing protein n=1 Tax=Aliiroseovarius zhejiangensis TaxID=1632025 RepID=A0ABQ3IS83_9RHOB|nr:PAS domain-containing protein [Aliiroseovarius zhejiangensis]GHE87761.1 hypothetical protein GCM10016455_04650 [Aliiroseovarius zhejiangensis]